MMNHTSELPTSNRFVTHQLPLLLFAVALISFNFLLNYFLTSDNPRPDLIETNVEAVVDSAETVTTNAIIGADAVVAVDARVGLMSVAGDLIASGWRTISGEWVADGATLRQTSVDEFDQVIVHDARVFESFAVEASMRHLTNIGGGLLFNMQRTDTLAGSHLVRFEVDGSAIYWGYFNDNREFVGQGFATVSVDPAQNNRIMVKSYANSYDVYLNDTRIIQNLPLQYTRGHIGLLSSKADVVFEDVNVLPIGGVGTAPAISEALISQAETITGEWIYEGDIIYQVANEETDYMTTLNVLGRGYLIEAEIDMNGVDAADNNGAGFIFHMSEREFRPGATMVRFLDGGEKVIWGQFDAENVFQGSGNLMLDLPPDEPVHLAVRVSATSYDILINGEERVSDLPLERNEGWIGLVTFRGGVSFADVRLNIGEY